MTHKEEGRERGADSEGERMCARESKIERERERGREGKKERWRGREREKASERRAVYDTTHSCGVYSNEPCPPEEELRKLEIAAMVMAGTIFLVGYLALVCR